MQAGQEMSHSCTIAQMDGQVENITGNKSVPKIIINDTIKFFLSNSNSILVITNHNSFWVLFDKIASVYFICNILTFSIGNRQPSELALSQLYWCTFIPYASSSPHNSWQRHKTNCLKAKYNKINLKASFGRQRGYASTRKEKHSGFTEARNDEVAVASAGTYQVCQSPHSR